MKLSGILLVGLLTSGCVLANPPETKFTVRVLDAETELPVTNATVWTTFTQKRDSWGTGEGKFNQVKLSVDQNGEVEIKGYQGKVERGASARAFADGYYTEGKGFKFTGKNMLHNRWKPWNPTIEIKMRKKKNPVSMTYKRQKWSVVPEFGKPVGYDLEIGDWMAPHGKGKTKDFLFVMNLDRKSMADAEASYTLTFSNPLDGIQEYLPPEGLRSSFIFPYVAPTNGYGKSLYQHDINTPYGPPETTEKENINYIFRVRTKTDEDGNIVSACYGRIKGELKISRKGQVEFSYCFNPNFDRWNSVSSVKCRRNCSSY